MIRVDKKDYYKGPIEDGEFWLYRPGGLETGDYWFFQEEGVCHAFFLEFHWEGCGTERRVDRQIGHAVSRDFKNWEYCGTVLRSRQDGCWPEENLATGSIVKYQGRYYMMYTGHSQKMGMGMAVSEDLYKWDKVGDGPIIDASVNYDMEYEGKCHKVRLVADPYMYPVPIDGYFYVYINSFAVDMPKNSRGCQAVFRSKDLLTWEPWKIAVLTAGKYDRLETCQVWESGGRWYMYFGGRCVDVNSANDFADVLYGNYVYASEQYDGPYLPLPKEELSLNSNRYYYIFKQLTAPDGNEVGVYMSIPEGLHRPRRLIYTENGIELQ